MTMIPRWRWKNRNRLLLEQTAPSRSLNNHLKMMMRALAGPAAALRCRLLSAFSRPTQLSRRNMHFHTQKVNAQRQRAGLSLSTYAMAQERMLCKFKLFFVAWFLFYFFLFFTYVSSFKILILFNVCARPELSKRVFLLNSVLLLNKFSFKLPAGFLGFVRTVISGEQLHPDCFFF